MYTHVIISEIGLVRDENEDFVLFHVPDTPELLEKKGVLAVVADGVGGGEYGKEASRVGAETLLESYLVHPAEDTYVALAMALKAANRKVFELRQVLGAATMGTTCTAAVFLGDQCILVHAGDSRAYLFRSNSLEQLTEDDRVGDTSSNAITKALGKEESISPSVYEYDLEKGDRYLFCSDGLTDMVVDMDIAPLMKAATVGEAAKGLRKAVYDAGARDNISFILMDV